MASSNIARQTSSASSRRRACRYGKNGYFGICTCDECRKIIVITDEMRLKWLHAGGEKDAGGCEWGIFRVKWDAQGQPVEVWQTLSDMSDLDAEIRREHLAKLGDASDQPQRPGE